MTAATSPRRRSRWLLVGVLLVAFCWALFLRSQLDDLRHYSWRISPFAFVQGIAWAGLYYTALGLCWTSLLRRMGASLGLTRGLRVWLLSMLTRYVPGNIWHILSRVALAERLGATRVQVFASATVEQLLTLIGALALFAATLPFWPTLPAARLWLLALLPLGLIALHPRLFGMLLNWAALRFRRPDMAWRYHFGEILLLSAGYLLAALFHGLALFAILNGLQALPLAWLPLVIGGSALAWAVGYLSLLTPSGLGVREGVLVLVLAQVVPLPLAVVASLLYRLASTLGELLAAAIAWLASENPEPRTNDQRSLTNKQ